MLAAVATIPFSDWFNRALAEADLGSLSADAVSLISAARGADTGYVEGGLLGLTQVAAVVERELVETAGRRGIYAAEKIERLRVRWHDGGEADLYVHSAGYVEGYQYDIYRSLESLQHMASPAPGPEGLTQLALDTFSYEPDLGYVRREER